jgi:peptidylprolyl isomerase
VAPKHVDRVKTLAREGEYDGVAFHRVIPGFMAQTGDVEHGDTTDGFNPGRVGTGGSKYPNLPAEFSKEHFGRGVVGMARAQNPDSANSQFFIMFEDGAFLNGQYTVFGRVIDGMEHVDAIKAGSRANNGAVRVRREGRPRVDPAPGTGIALTTAGAAILEPGIPGGENAGERRHNICTRGEIDKDRVVDPTAAHVHAGVQIDSDRLSRRDPGGNRERSGKQGSEHHRHSGQATKANTIIACRALPRAATGKC